MRPYWRWMLALALAVPCAGCGEGGPALTPVEGTVLFDGKPLGDAELTFIPDQGNVDVTPGTGITDSDGEYKARYLGRFGLAPGKYKITVSKTEVAPDMGNIPPEMLNDPEQLRLSGAVTQTMPDTYANLDKTAFTIEVAQGGGPYDFELDSKGR